MHDKPPKDSARAAGSAVLLLAATTVGLLVHRASVPPERREKKRDQHDVRETDEIGARVEALDRGEADDAFGIGVGQLEPGGREERRRERAREESDQRYGAPQLRLPVGDLGLELLLDLLAGPMPSRRGSRHPRWCRLELGIAFSFLPYRARRWPARPDSYKPLRGAGSRVGRAPRSPREGRGLEPDLVRHVFGSVFAAETCDATINVGMGRNRRTRRSYVRGATTFPASRA